MGQYESPALFNLEALAFVEVTFLNKICRVYTFPSSEVGARLRAIVSMVSYNNARSFSISALNLIRYRAPT